MEIPDPVALPEKEILVRNYKMRPAIWEKGTVRSACFYPGYNCKRIDGSTFDVPARWRYEVWIDRPARERGWGGGYLLTVSDDGVRKLAREVPSA